MRVAAKPTQTTLPSSAKVVAARATHSHSATGDALNLTLPHRNKMELEIKTTTTPLASLHITPITVSANELPKMGGNAIAFSPSVEEQRPLQARATINDEILSIVTRPIIATASYNYTEIAADEETIEKDFGTVSPILGRKSSRPSSRTSISSVGAARASTFRLKFQKSHTCGSLFAKCNCSPTTSSTPPPPAVPLSKFQQTDSTPELVNAAALLHCSLSPNRSCDAAPISNATTTTTSTLSKLNSNSSTTSTCSSTTAPNTTTNTSTGLSHDDSSYSSVDMPTTGGGTSEFDDVQLYQSAKNNVSSCIASADNRKISSPTQFCNSPAPTTSTSREPRRSKPKRLFQSYSHPDTDFIFTDENKNPSRESLTLRQNQLQPQTITSRSGKIEIRHPKRSSSPNIGQYQVLDVVVHPDFLVKISPKHSPIVSRSTQERRQLLQRSNEFESGGSHSDSESPSTALDPGSTVTTPLKRSPITSPLSPTVASKKLVVDDSNFSAAQKYFQESGILGPINTSTNLIRKTSKILQDPNVIEQIRKTSMILRGTSTSSKQSTSSKITDESMNQSTIYQRTTATQPLQAQLSSTLGLNCKSDDRDVQIKNLQGEIVSLKDVIKSRDSEINKLRREIHKLKSVLQQTTNHLPISNDDLLQTNLKIVGQQQQQSQQLVTTTSRPIGQDPDNTLCGCGSKIANVAEKISEASGALARGILPNNTGVTEEATARAVNRINGRHIASYPPIPTSTTNTMVTCALDASGTQADADADVINASAAKSKLCHIGAPPVLKKQGVSGESCESSIQQSINVPIPKFEKDFSSKQLIKDAIMDNDFLKNIDSSQVRELVESMYNLEVAKGQFVIREGEAGSHLFVSAEGEFEVVKNNKVLGIMGPRKAFGELAILYNCTRTASVRVLSSDARVWVLDRRVFQQIMMRTGMQRIENSVNFLKSVPLLKNLSGDVLAKIADVLEVEFYPAGTYIIRQGASGDTFFLISQGSVQVTQKLGPSAQEKEIRTLQRGDYFGEQALINEDKRTANIIAMAPGVECLTLDRESFTHLIGDLCELKEKNYGDENRVLAMKYAEQTREIFGSNVRQEFPDMKLTDLEVVATLGIGGFGRVELVKAYQENRVDTFALKCLKKKHIMDTRQEEHVFSERTIMLTCHTPFICRLYRTFRDDKFVYMLLEACMGGEVWTMLRDRGSFDENATQFIIACVLQAFEYLHSRGIIYRDLKPENLMLDERGYVKLVDFGFAKYIGNSSKTWTFCGTPEYVAPEIILNKGHDRAVDYWALGILIHELLNGTPPFTANDPMKTYNIILKGIDMIDFPKHMTRSAVQLIKKLCRDVPAERLGYQKGGIQDIKKHKWFLGFDWDGLTSQVLIPPFVRPVAHPTDTCYFDKFPCDPTVPADENSGWDADF